MSTFACAWHPAPCARRIRCSVSSPELLFEVDGRSGRRHRRRARPRRARAGPAAISPRRRRPRADRSVVTLRERSVGPSTAAQRVLYKARPASAANMWQAWWTECSSVSRWRRRNSASSAGPPRRRQRRHRSRRPLRRVPRTPPCDRGRIRRSDAAGRLGLYDQQGRRQPHGLSRPSGLAAGTNSGVFRQGPPRRGHDGRCGRADEARAGRDPCVAGRPSSGPTHASELSHRTPHDLHPALPGNPRLGAASGGLPDGTR